MDDSQADQLQQDGATRSEQAAVTPGTASAAAEPRRAESSRAKRSPPRGRRAGRPATNPQRQARTYRDKLRAAGADVAAICAANAWARDHRVALDNAAELVERHATATAQPEHVQPELEPVEPARQPAPPYEATPTGPVLEVPYQVVTPEAPPASEPELVQPADPAGFAALGEEEPVQEPAAEAAEEPSDPDTTYMGEPADLVEACSQSVLFLLGSLAELTRGHPLVDLTRPVERVLFRGTPVERTVRGDPVVRITELCGVGLARRAQAAVDAVDGPPGKPGIAWELVPLGLALALPFAGAATGIAVAGGKVFMRGARGAAAGVGRLFTRGRR
ncbi:hypothetical protein HUA74_18395 [Myxococcus sp. CA051A]|uniref:hypothetical protein n=1 Tax=Myxococcus sp. CA051A TaxID=2741739 RepID=UPI00157B020B|nr:hypothetical protein [Myxococcus sp. CA051A]NTX62625.1 hypothetical protein [Myxococcus sp. CA051A]